MRRDLFPAGNRSSDPFAGGKRSTVLDTNGSLRFILVSLANGSFDSVCKKLRSSHDILYKQ